MESRRLLDPANISTPAYKRLLKTYGAKNIYELVALAAASGARLGRANNQPTNAVKFFANQYNNEIKAAKERVELDRIAKKEAEERAKIAKIFGEKMKKNKEKFEAASRKVTQRRSRVDPNVFWTSYCVFRVAYRAWMSDGKEAPPEIREISNSFVGKSVGDLDTAIDDYMEALKMESPILWIVLLSRKDKKHKAQKSNIMKEPIREAGAVDLNGLIANEEWCKNNGMCVPDWLMHKYGNIKGHIKSVKSVEIIERLSTFWLDDVNHKPDEPYIKNHPNRDGYTLENIDLFCRNTGKTLIALHNGEIILERRNEKCEDPLIIEVKNNHLYPITDNKAIRSLTHRGTVSCFKAKKGKEKEGVREQKPIEFVEYEGCPYDFIIDTIQKRNIQPYGQKLQISHGTLHNFELNGTLYCSTPHNEHVEDFCKRNNIPYEGQSPLQFLRPFLDKLPVSKPNNEICQALYRDGVKHRTHLGLFNTHTDGDLVGCDINKHYRNVMTNPFDNWMTIDSDAVVQVRNEFTREFGLWYIKTDDMTLMHKSNWYSNNMLDRATQMGIQFTPMYFIKGTRQDVNLLSKIINELTTYFDNPEMTKLVINALSGCLGQTVGKKATVYVDTNVQRVWDTFMKHKQDLTQMIYHERDGIHVYGTKKEIPKMTTNLPMYIQILDWANIRLNDLILKHGGYNKLIYRKTDEFVMLRIKGHDYGFSLEVGGIKETATADREFKDRERDHVEYKHKAMQWNPVNAVKTSDDHDKVVEFLKSGKSMMISSRAGTGKSYIIHKVAQAMPVVKIAYTNKAANNIGGMTIHRFLGIDSNGEINLGEVLKMVSQYGAIVVDEYSMIPDDLWFMLYRVKQSTKVPFLVCGDYRQLPPVEERKNVSVGYSNHPNVMFICGYNRTELAFTDKCRYDKDMADYLDRIWDEDPTLETPYSKCKSGSHICYTNAKRKEINKALNTEGVLIPFEGTPNAYNEDIRLGVGTKLLALTTNVKLNIIKNETYQVTEVDDTSFQVGDKVIQITQLHTLFCLAYCITIHKAQGMTISGVLNIHQLELVKKDKRMLYTAVSRATSLDNIRLVREEATIR